jgi:hypothetical protein
MLQFIVLGLVPGTNLQITFSIVIDVLTAIAVVVFTPRILHYAEERKRTIQQ